MTHPLTDEKLHQEFDGYYPADLKDILDGSFSVFEADSMRDVANWQLEQCEDEVSQMLALMVLSRKINREEKIGLLETFKSHMRPTTTEEDS